MLRGTRVIFADEADRFVDTVDRLRRVARAANYREVILPALWSLETFRQKLGDELTGQMWTFKDKGDRDVCLIPEATEVVRELYRGWWAKSLPKPVRVFYAARCYRYERPQAGRYREFTQFGVEVLGGDPEATAAEVVALLHTCLAEFAVPYEFSAAVKRGLSYYVADGFEAAVPALGAQRQVAGGGRYADGVGWAIGVDRLVMALAAPPPVDTESAAPAGQNT